MEITEMREMIEEMREETQKRVAALGVAVGRKRDEAVIARKSSGIETIWREDEEYHQGIDDANRNTTAWTKSASVNGGVEGGTKATDGRCSAFFNMIRPFVDSAGARMGDILLPVGDWNFAMKPTPVPDEGDAEARVKKVESRIRDWLTECRYHSEMRKCLHDLVLLGTCIIKGPGARKKKSAKASQNSVEMAEEIVPGSYRVDPWNAFPDPNCGESIHNGEYFIERDLYTARRLRDLKGVTGYIDESIDLVLEEGPGKRNFTKDGIQEKDTKEDDRFEVWYFHGYVSADDLAACGVEAEGDVIPAVVTLVNDTVIRAYVNPLDSGEFPYDAMAWQRVPDSVFGVGVARQGRTAQEMLNAAARSLMDNAGISSGPQLVIRHSAIVPADGDYTISPRKVWIATNESDNRSVADSILAINIPMMQVELANIVMMAKKEMEDSTGVSFLLMGQQGSAPDTVGGMELVNKNASAFLRDKARFFDECITEPHINRYNEWLQVYGPDESEKGEVVIQALGSSALVEREIQSMETMQILQMSMNPAFGLDPSKAIKEYLKAKRFDPSRFELDEDQKAKMAQQPPPPMPQVMAAQINAQAGIQKAQIAAQASLQKAKMDTDRDTVYVQAEMQRSNTTAQLRIEELKLKREIAYIELQVKKGIEVDSNKVKLADTAMKLRVQKELAAASLMTPQVVTPPMEPRGRAPNGEAYQR